MAGTWNPTVKLVEANDSDLAVNQSLTDLIERTNYLKCQLDQSVVGKGLVDSEVASLSTTSLGQAVYWNTTNAQYEPAQALWQDTFGDNGELLAAESSFYAGIVVKKHSSTVVDVLISGKQSVSDSNLLTNLFGTSSPASGTYYLSATTPGSVTSTVPGMLVLALTVNAEASSVDISIPIVKHDQHGHIHKVFELDESNFIAASSSQFDNFNVPVTASLGYDRDSDSSLDELFSLIPSAAVVQVDGVTVHEDFTIVNEDNIWWVPPAGPLGRTVIYAAFPITHGQPIIRAIDSTGTELTITSVNGKATIDMAAWSQTGSTTNSATAVSTVDGRNYTLTPNISGVEEGPGASVAVSATGVATVSLDSALGTLINADLINLNNAVAITESPYILYKFPASREASISGRVPLSGFTSSSVTATIWVQVEGITGATTGTPIQYPAMDITARFVPTAQGSDYIVLPTTDSLTETLVAFNTVQGRLYFKQTTGTIAVTGNGTMYIEASIDSSVNDKRLYSFGVALTVT
jgi:hypothetical protein